jgi:hypothetical protein
VAIGDVLDTIGNVMITGHRCLHEGAPLVALLAKLKDSASMSLFEAYDRVLPRLALSDLAVFKSLHMQMNAVSLNSDKPFTGSRPLSITPSITQAVGMIPKIMRVYT